MSFESQNSQVQRTADVDMSTVILKTGVNIVKKNPIVVSSYVLGILLCLLFSGFTLTIDQQLQYERDLSAIDFEALERASLAYEEANYLYSSSRGFFSCDDRCTYFKKDMEAKKQEFVAIETTVNKLISDAKAKLGVFSETAVQEARDIFWTRFNQGKSFAQRQSKWDALFMGIGAMGRDENLLSYILRLLLSVAFNFTIGMIGAVITFMWSLFSFLSTYQADALTTILFYIGASVAALSFVTTWVMIFYGAIAGSIYVVAKNAAEHARIQEGQGGYQRRHVRGGPQHYD